MTNGIITEFDSKEVMKVRMRFGAEGYLAYVAIQELLLRSEECRMECDYDAIAAEICVEPDVIKGVVESLGLFVLTDGYFTSETITAFCEEQKRRQKMYSERARKGGEGKAALSRKQCASSTGNGATSINNAASSNKNNALSIQNAASSTEKPALSTDDEKKASPIPPIKKTALTGGSQKENLFGFNGAGTDTGESDNGQTDIKQPKKREKIVVPTARARDEVWIPKYKSLYDEEPYVDGVEMTHLKNLLVKLRNKRLNKGMTIDDDGILEAFKVFLDRINKDWIYNNYSLKQINSHFNEIISQINNKQKPQHYENNTTREKDRRGTPVDESFQNLDYEERF